LERESDLNKLHDPEAFFRQFGDRFICLDEIQRQPGLFPLLRSEIDRRQRNGQFLILGSASRELIQQSSESLAGRIAHREITPFRLPEVGVDTLAVHWLRGGYPRSFLAGDNQQSTIWREEYIKTFLEQDIPNLGFSIPAPTLRRFWRMLAHHHGQLLNISTLAAAMGMATTSIRRYLDLLEQTFVIRSLPAYAANLKKRLVKTPKVYIRDSGLLHALSGIETDEDLFASPLYGVSFEGYVIENLLSGLPRWEASFYRSSNGAEADLILQKGQRTVVVEIKASSAPKAGKHLHNIAAELQADECILLGNVEGSYPSAHGIRVMSLAACLAWLGGM
ncbi:MAG: ATP-binding protein, partial [Pseudomonadales bacterium]|nr:ATP-binding protein [Pseudomonadales bacterium]